MDAEMKERLRMAGLADADLAWFDSFGCDDKAVPAPRGDEIGDYRRREAALNASISALSFSERGVLPEGRLAAAIGARIADATEPDEDD